MSIKPFREKINFDRMRYGVNNIGVALIVAGVLDLAFNTEGAFNTVAFVMVIVGVLAFIYSLYEG